MCERWFGDWTNCNILTPSSIVFSSTSFSFCWAAQSGVLRAHSSLLGSRSLYSILSPANWLQLTEVPVAPGYIIAWHPPASCERRICTQFNPSTVKVIPWYLRPDAPVSWSTAGSICYRSPQENVAYESIFISPAGLFMSCSSLLVYKMRGKMPHS